MSLPSNQTEKVAIVTGSSTGIGFATSLALARNGFQTYATVRNLAKPKPSRTWLKRRACP